MRAHAAFTLRVWVGAMAVLAPPSSAASQPSQTPPPDAPRVGVTLTADVLRELPLGGNVYSILETILSEAVTDRFNSGGLNGGGTSDAVALLGSRRQTRYRLGDIDITGPAGGAPLFFPELAFWEQVEVATGSMPADVNAPGLAISLDPRRPSPHWTGSAEGFVSRPGLVSGVKPNEPPPISRLRDWTHGSLLVSGPIGRRMGLVAGGALTESGTLVRGRNRARERARSLFGQFTLTPASRPEVRTLGWFQAARARAPHAIASEQLAARDSAVHLQTTIEQRARDRVAWRIFGGYTQRRRDEELPPEWRVVDRLFDGPVPTLIGRADSLERRWTLGGRMAPARRMGRHHPDAGLEYTVAAERASAAPVTTVGELVDGLPARVWSYATSGLDSRRRATTIAAFARDRFDVSRTATLHAALGFDSAAGRAEGAAASIGWHTLLPSVSVQWELGTRWDLSAFTGYRRSANELTLDLLAQGDPAAPVANVFRWDVLTNSPGPLVARVGPGTGGDPAFSAIDPHLKRPHTDELVIALESGAHRTARFGIAGIARREASLVNLVNAGVPMTGYRTFSIRDANVDLIGSADDQFLPVYDRLPESFGTDRYVLTNPVEDPATMGALLITARVARKRLFLLIGATASAVIGPGGHRGYRANENDQDTIGELFTNPNASTHARGRLFGDRAYAIKWTTVYRFPKDLRLGAIARYQDGQPFSRLVIVSGLQQGVEAIQAFANGRSRFAFTGTLDIRLQKGLAAGPARIDLVLDAYNLLGLRKEVEEDVVTGERFRSRTTLQPPRAAHVGMRVVF